MQVKMCFLFRNEYVEINSLKNEIMFTQHNPDKYLWFLQRKQDLKL